MQTLTITRPDDWHLHVRDGAALAAVVPDTARRFGRAIIMPNLRPPVVNAEQARAYRDRILAAVPAGLKFEPLMTLYLTDNTAPDEIDRALETGFIPAVKLYPAGATTNSDAGVTAIDTVRPALERMEKSGMVLCVHGEVTHADVDIFDRERVFIDRVLAPLAKDYPALRIVFEHITTREAAQFVTEAGPNVGATITAHHLLLNRNAIFAGGINPHHYCLPVLKRELHREALVAAAISGSPKFFLGTDSAPHARGAKESACGCAGCYTANTAIELYAEAFDAAGALDRLEGFASHFGPDFYRLPRNTDTLTLTRADTAVPAQLDYLPDDPLIPLRAGGTVAWQLS
ncbi:dihydroorotase [Denitromonas ohlonensis]|uniref:Dihydroorotase n=2 Tax=Denitromonas TaxID=139331 RepID=A0A557SF64_9RHOO|nr:dihydroorotase [Denitromonas ohlonensis]TVT46795.1 MAG: dihydroorotase [Denitromonas halophila]TVO64165.1 dihydroorotase [Denitromonas ohlonensis]TVO76066.1 dihydroorotase [Denitromonas ohlonensis]TVT73235.1 MAG: dihydroorotase [Denitromonas halophila]TVT77454.1 MAG: dihydroorotase [Denitromonas halophila]